MVPPPAKEDFVFQVPTLDQDNDLVLVSTTQSITSRSPRLRWNSRERMEGKKILLENRKRSRLFFIDSDTIHRHSKLNLLKLLKLVAERSISLRPTHIKKFIVIIMPNILIL